MSQGVQARDNVYYRWQDENGVWQISQTPHPEKENIVVMVDTNANVLKSLPKEEIDKAFGRNQPQVAADVEDEPKAPTIPIPATIPLEEIPKLIDRAKGVQDLADQRQKMMEQGL
jgi:hypothetical protein